MQLAYKQFYQLSRRRPIEVFDEMVYGSLHKDSKAFYLDGSYGSDNYSGRSRKSPFATIAAAYDACTASKGDKIIIQATHTETVTSVLTASKIGVQIIGEMSGNKRPVITGNGTIDVISFTAANQLIANLEFAAPLTDAQTADINIAAAGVRVINTKHLGSVGTENKVNIITITADGDDALIEGTRIYNTVVEVPGAILFEGAATNVELKDVKVYDSIGFTNGAIYDAAAATGVIMENCTFMNAKAATAVINFANNSVGYGTNIGVCGRHTTIASNVVAGTGFQFFPAYVVEEAGKSGMVWNVDAD